MTQDKRLLPLRALIIVAICFILGAVAVGSQGSRPPVLSNLHWPWSPRLQVPGIDFAHDEDGDGIDDLSDIVLGARAEVERAPRYRGAYYQGGYPPIEEGVCTDLIWRALRDAGYDLKTLVDEDISRNVSVYPRVEGSPDPNIDFRRVQNLSVFFQRRADILTIEIIPGDVENLSQWQPGDIVVWDRPYAHIAIISNKRRPDGVPYILHNGGPVPRESDRLLTWPSELIWHFRFPRSTPGGP